MAKNKSRKSSHKNNRSFQKSHKPNPILAAQAHALTAKHQANAAYQSIIYKAQLNILLQMAEDACLVSTAEVRGLGPDNAEKLRIEFRKTINEMSNMMVDDDDDTLYARTKIDQRLAQIEGPERAKPWEPRFAWCTAILEGKK